MDLRAGTQAGRDSRSPGALLRTLKVMRSAVSINRLVMPTTDVTRASVRVTGKSKASDALHLRGDHGLIARDDYRCTPRHRCRWRIESARLIAGLARMVRDVGLAEELAQDALVIALEKWPATGVPDNPGAWLMATAKHRAIDRLRRSKLQQRKHEELGHELEREQEAATAELEAASTTTSATTCCG